MFLLNCAKALTVAKLSRKFIVMNKSVTRIDAQFEKRIINAF